jgi:membrane-bound lytic murein transglycosylase
MKLFLLLFFFSAITCAQPKFTPSSPSFSGNYEINGVALCTTAQHTLDYLNKGQIYDPEVIHEGKVIKIPLAKVKATLRFICSHRHQLNDPAFVKQHFEFIRWYPDKAQTISLASQKPLLNNLPTDRILMTKYYVHLAKASTKKEGNMLYPLYGLPKDEQHLTLEQANGKPQLTRFQYGKQAILNGALQGKMVPVLAYLSRDDLEAALLQGTVVADFGSPMGKKIFNVHRCNNIAYNRQKNPYEQERFWYFKQVDGIKGYGKDAEHKISVNPTVTFAADLPQLGLGKLLLIQYNNASRALITQAGVLADTGGAFANNLYQVDYLAGSYSGKTTYLKATRHLPDYVYAYFMVLKD